MISGLAEGSPPDRSDKQIKIEFLYLDLTVCGRCQRTESILNEALDDAASDLEAAGFKILMEKIHVDTEEQAVRYRFYASPTIRINGRDIALELHESDCKECGSLCGDSIDCRTWVYEGVEYDHPPKALVIKAILEAVNGNALEGSEGEDEYVMPENLKAFFRKSSRL